MLMTTPDYITEWRDNLFWYMSVFRRLEQSGDDDGQHVRNAWQLAAYTTKPSHMRAFNQACALYRLNREETNVGQTQTADDAFLFYNEEV